MSCSCSISACDDYSELGAETNPKARVSHRCGECHREIVKGEVYERFRGLCDGSWFTAKTCIDCKSVRESLFCSWTYGTMWDDFRELYEGDKLPSSDCMMKMTKAARDKVCDIIEDGWDRFPRRPFHD